MIGIRYHERQAYNIIQPLTELLFIPHCYVCVNKNGNENEDNNLLLQKIA